MFKKITLTSITLVIAVCAIAQSAMSLQDQVKLISYPAPAKKISIASTLWPSTEATFANVQVSKNKPSSTSQASKLLGLNEAIIGNTIYDLQTNNAISDRLQLVGSNLYAVWTMSQDAGGGYPDRGTGYNYYNGTAWDAVPSVRIETERCGFTNIVIPSGVGGYGEVVVSHNTQSPTSQENWRTTAGSGTWNESLTILASSAQEGNLWNKMAVSGNNVHVINVTAPTGAIGGALWNGQDAALMYYRSQDGGTTWDITNYVIPLIADSAEYEGWSADTYQIDADGNNVSIVLGTRFTDLLLLTSTDNGSTWTKEIIFDFPIPNYQYDSLTDENGDLVADTILAASGDANILVDATGKAHVWFSVMNIIDDTPGDGFYSYFPGTDGLFYWNSDMATGDGILCASALDLDGDQVLTLADNIAGYYGAGGLTIQPSPGIDENGRLYLSYCSVVENTADPDLRSLRHVYITTSDDGGATWNYPEDVVSDPSAEGAFGSLTRNVNIASGHVYVCYQKDYCGGHALSTQDPCNSGADNNEIICVDAAPVSIEEPNTFAGNDIVAYPNPSTGIFSLSFKSIRNGEVNISIMNDLGQTVKSFDMVSIYNGKAKLNLEDLTTGNYLISVASETINATTRINISK